MIGKIERLKKKMELQLESDIFDLDVLTFYKHYGIYGTRYYSRLRLECFFNNYKINKYVFDQCNVGKIIDVMIMMHNIWLKEANYVRRKRKIFYEIRSDICFEYYDAIPNAYKYYRKLNELYIHILTKIKNCKTLPNKTYTTKERRN